jgi:hypothetical protein
MEMEANMDERLREMLDHHEIRKLLARYCHTCDRADEVSMAATYSAESWDDHGPRKMDGRRFSHEITQEAVEFTKVVSHQLGQSLIRVEGNQAGAETYFIAAVVYPTAEGGELINLLAGRYIDELIREAEEWKFKHRTCVREWSISLPVESDWLAGSEFVPARRGPQDEAYRVLKMQHLGELWRAFAGGESP